MLFTVAICTYNRSQLLRQTLRALEAVEVPAGLAWELVVVDNNSSDDTQRVLREVGGPLPLRTVVERQQGLSHARNCAAAHARGEYVLFSDDDVVFDRRWLACYTDAVRAHPQAAFFGGPIEPGFECEPPAWLVDALPDIRCAFGGIGYGTVAGPLTEQTLPFGANFAVRRDVLLRHPFNPDLGVRGSKRLVGEETEAMTRMLAAGECGWSVPGAGVRHFVPAEKMSLRYIREYFVSQGRSHRVRSAPWRGPTLLGRPRHLWRALAEAEWRYLAARALRGRSAAVPHLVHVSKTLGMLGMRAPR